MFRKICPLVLCGLLLTIAACAPAPTFTPAPPTAPPVAAPPTPTIAQPTAAPAPTQTPRPPTLAPTLLPTTTRVPPSPTAAGTDVPRAHASMKHFDVDKAKDPNAICNDGSTPAFFYRRGYGSGAAKWIVFLEGGGACWDNATCSTRDKPLLLNFQ